MESRDYVAAERTFRGFLQGYPRHQLAGNAQFWIGEIYFARKDYVNASIAYAEGYRNYPRSPKAPDNLLQLGRALALAPAQATDPLRQRLACLQRRRDQLVAARADEKKRLATAEDEEVRASIMQHIVWIDAEIARLQRVIDHLVAGSVELAALRNRLQTAPGVGPVTALTLIALMPELGQRSAKTIAALAGLAPFNNDSGAFRGAQAQWDRITVPMLTVGNWSGMALHLRGNTEAFMRAASKHKKLRIHAGTHVHPFYSEDGRRDQLRFFDYWLKGIDNGVMDEPPVKLAIRKGGDEIEWRHEHEWPLARTRWTRLFLDLSAPAPDRE